MSEDGKKEEWMKGWSDSGYAPLPIAPSSPPKVNLNVLNYDVTEDDKKTFNEKGYWIGPKILDDDTVAVLRKEMYRIFGGEVDFPSTPYEYDYYLKKVRDHHKNAPSVRKINNAWYINAAVRELAHHKVIGKIAAKLLDTPEIRLWHDQAIWKPGQGENATDSGNIGWHQDYGYWQSSNSSQMLTAWIPLQDVGLENGAMRTIVGSHKWGLVPESAAFFDRDMDKLKEKFGSLANGNWIDEPCNMKAGHIVFHHALTFHGSGPNKTNNPRLAIAIHMMSKDCGYQSGKGWHHNVKDLGPYAKDGDLFEGPLFPVLYKQTD